MIDCDTRITSKKYKTIGNLLKAPITSIILVSGKERDNDIKTYLFEWLYLKHYSKLDMSEPLTTRTKKIANIPCYGYICKHAFENINILQQTLPTKTILNYECTHFIKYLHDIDPSLAGVFLDYLIRRIISEQTNIVFEDSRSNWNIQYMEYMLDCVNLPTSISDSYKIVKDTACYKTKNILLETFITSLNHTIFFLKTPPQDKVDAIIHLIQTTSNVVDAFYEPLNELCINLLSESRDVLLNPTLGETIPLLNDKRIPSDCDLVINDVLYDIKCTSAEKDIYEILQLLGYASLLYCVPKFNKKIRIVSKINLLQGFIISYDISQVTPEQMLNYLKILTRSYI